MKYIKKECGSFNLHMIKTKKHKTTTITIIFRDILKKEEITIRNFLADMLIYSTKKYPKRNEMKKALQDLYSVGLDSKSYRLGRYYNTEFTINFLNEKYSEKGMEKNSIKFLKEVLFNPNVVSNEFDNSSFSIIKESTKKTIESIKEDTRKYSMIKLFENMDKDMPYTYHSFGYTEDLDKITPKNLYEYYLNFINQNMIDIFVIGDIDFNSYENIIRDEFKFRTFKRREVDTIIKHEKFRKTVKKVTEEEKVAQSKLAIGCKIGNISEFERNYVLTIYNIILGNGSNSKLFEDVREKNSLCYNIFSSPYKLDSILIISAGIARSNASKAIRLIKKNLKEMTKGKFSDEEIEKAKKRYINSVDTMLEYPSAVISSYYAMELLNTDEIEKRKEEIMKVTGKDIENLAKKIYLDTIYLLGGEDNNE